MIRIIASFQVRPESVEQFLAMARPLVAASVAEPGNVFYEMLRSRENPAHLTFLEGWADDDAVAAHNASPHFTTLVPQLLEMTEAEPSITQYIEA